MYSHISFLLSLSFIFLSYGVLLWSSDVLATEIGCHLAGLITVPIAAQATFSHVAHVLSLSQLQVLVVDASVAVDALRLINETQTAVQTVAVLGPLTDAIRSAAGKVQLVSLSELESQGLLDNLDQTQIGMSSSTSTWLLLITASRARHLR